MGTKRKLPDGYEDQSISRAAAERAADLERERESRQDRFLRWASKTLREADVEPDWAVELDGRVVGVLWELGPVTVRKFGAWDSEGVDVGQTLVVSDDGGSTTVGGDHWDVTRKAYVVVPSSYEDRLAGQYRKSARQLRRRTGSWIGTVKAYVVVAPEMIVEMVRSRVPGVRPPS